MVGLERALVQYCSQPNDQPFDIKTVPIETAPSLAEGPRCKGNKINYLDGDLFPISKGNGSEVSDLDFSSCRTKN